MTVLYRKYRPQSFADVAGQAHVKNTLAHEIASGRLAHSYLFTGPRGVGKTTTARIFAKALNCAGRKKGSGEPCGTCGSCVEIAEGRNLDVIEIDAASHTGVDDVREQIIETARFAPTKSARKIFIIDEVHMLSTSAFNALLKTLEEPPAHAVFILATTELHKLPATVVSRCQRFDFKKIGREELVARLADLSEREGAEVDADVLDAVARQSEGCLRDAESLLTQLLSMGEKRVTAETAALVMPVLAPETVHALAEALILKQGRQALAIWSDLLGAGADPLRIMSELTDAVRRLALAHVKEEAYAPPFSLGEAWQDRLARLRAALPPAESSKLLGRLLEALDAAKWSESPELPMELLILERGTEDQGDDDVPPPAPRAVITEAPAPKAAEPRKEPAGSGPAVSLADVRRAWSDIMRKAQEKHHGLPYMLGATELVSCEDGELTLGFQYALYRNRLNEQRHKNMLEEAVFESLNVRLTVKAILVAQKTDGTVEAAPNIVVAQGAALPDGFAELVKEFGGSV